MRPARSAFDTLQPSSRQRALIALARRLAHDARLAHARLAHARFAPRADHQDGNASFPFDDFADFRAEGLLGLCVPER
jgi:alkylation response protein AidB-like acyl-CoA dehydrogenase